MNESRKRSWSVQLAPFRYDENALLGRNRYPKIMQKHITKCTKTRSLVNNALRRPKSFMQIDCPQNTAGDTYATHRCGVWWRARRPTRAAGASMLIAAQVRLLPSRRLHNSSASRFQVFFRARTHSNGIKNHKRPIRCKNIR